MKNYGTGISIGSICIHFYSLAHFLRNKFKSICKNLIFFFVVNLNARKNNEDADEDANKKE